MIQVGNVILSLDILTEEFVCDLKACRGACCVEGDAGAPVTLEEIAAIEELLPVIWQNLDREAQRIIRVQGVAYSDPEGELVTSIVRGKDCVFTVHDGKNCYCAMERACREGRCSFMKPVSCHLYPIRVKKIGEGWGLNYHKWDVCRAAVELGKRLHTPLYEYLKEPLIRRFGQEWYDELLLTVSELKKQGYI